MGRVYPAVRRGALALAVVATLAFLERSADASPSAKLVYVRGTGTAACPPEEQLRKAVATRIGYDPFFPAAQKTVIAQVTRTSDGYRGQVQIVGDDGRVRGERDLATKGDDCAEIVTTIALAVSIALDDLDEEEHNAAPPAAPAPEPEPEPAPEVLQPDDRLVLPPSHPARRAATDGPRIDLRASAGPVVSVGAAPAPALGASVAAMVGYGAVAARLNLRGDLPASGSLSPTGKVSTNTLLAVLSGCLRAGAFACLGAGIGSIASQTEGIAQPAADRGRLVVLVATLGVNASLGRVLYVEPFLDGTVSLTPQRVELDGSRAFSLPTIAGALGLHIGGKFL